MDWNGSGVVVPNNGVHSGDDLWTQDKDAGDQATASRFDTFSAKIADALEACLNRNAENKMASDNDMDTFKWTNNGAGAALTDLPTMSQVKNNLGWGGTSTGSANAHAITTSPAITAYAAGQHFQFLAGYSNTGATTLDVDTLGTKAVQRHGNALTGGEIVSGALIEVVYDGTQFQLLSQAPQAYCHVQIAEDSSSFATTTEKDIFADANYPGTLDYATEVTEQGITFTQANGRFTAAAAGIYEVSLHVGWISDTNFDGIIFHIAVNGADAYVDRYMTQLYAANEQARDTITVPIALTAGQYLNFNVESLLGNWNVLSGSSVWIRKLVQ